MFPTCTTKEFKDDISKLCDNCPLTEKIKKGIKEQIIFQTEQKKSILTDDQFKKYLNAEIENATKSMDYMFMESQNNTNFMSNIIEVYIWNKERIKALNSFKNGQNEKDVLKFSEIFIIPYSNVEKINELKQLLKNNGFIDNDNKWIGNTGDLKELAYLYWYLKEQKGIIQPGVFSKQIKSFYKEFGLLVYVKKTKLKVTLQKRI